MLDPTVPYRRRIFDNIQKTLYWSGLSGMYLASTGIQGAVILMYHSISDLTMENFIAPGNRLDALIFENQMRYLARNRTVISLTELVDLIEEGKTPEAGTVVLTFDDGYKDNLDIAAPILEQYNFPATFYLPTGLVTRSENQWVDDLYAAFATRTEHKLEIAGKQFDLTDDLETQEANAAAHTHLLKADKETRNELRQSLLEQLQPALNMPHLTMTWEEALTLGKNPLFELGVHTVNHVDISNQNSDQVEYELSECVSEYEKYLQAHPKHFSFPYNRSCKRAIDLLKSLEIRSATGANSDFLITSSSDPFSLARISTTYSGSLFRFWTSGAYPSLTKTLFNRV